LKKISLTAALGNKTGEQLQLNQKSNIEQKAEQVRKNGLSI